MKPETEASLSPGAMAQPHSLGLSRLPYLFGGLGAMLGLVGFALLILACSYWRLSGRLANSNNTVVDAERDVESGEKGQGDFNEQVEVYEEKLLVIMAGEEKPTFFATPVSAKASSSGKVEEKEGLEKPENGEEMSYGHEELPTITENSDSQVQN